MQPHVKIYLNYFDYGMDDFVPCELCGRRSVDIHHIQGRGKGKNVITNLMALCRSCHTKAHTSVNKAVMQARHDIFLENKSKS